MTLSNRLPGLSGQNSSFYHFWTIRRQVTVVQTIAAAPTDESGAHRPRNPFLN